MGITTFRVHHLAGHLSRETDGCWAVSDLRSLHSAEHPEKISPKIVQEALRFHVFVAQLSLKYDYFQQFPLRFETAWQIIQRIPLI